MKRIEKLMKNSLILVIGNIGSKLIVFFLVPLYTYYLTTSQYGTIDLITTTVQLLLPIASLGLADSVIRFGLDNKYNQNLIFTNSLIAILFSSSIVVFLLVVFNGFYSIPFIFYLTSLVCIQNMQTFISTYIRSQEKLYIYIIGNFLYAFLIGIFNIYFIVLLNWNISGYFVSQILSGIISIVILIIFSKVFQYFSIKSIDKGTIKDLLSFSIPLIPSGIAWWLINSFSRYILLFLTGVDANGIYAVSTKIPSLINILQNIFIQAWQMSAIEEEDSTDKEQYYSSMIKAFIEVNFILLCLFIFIIKPMTILIFNHAYIDSWEVAVFLLIATIYNAFSNFIGQIFISEKNSKIIFKTTLVSAGITCLLSVTLTSLIGINGAGIAQMIGWLISFLYRMKEIKQVLKIDFNHTMFWLNQLFLGAQVINIFLLNNITFFFVQSVLIIIVIIINKEILLMIIKKFRR